MLGGRVAFNTRSMTLSPPIQHGPRSSIAVFAFLSREGWFRFALFEVTGEGRDCLEVFFFLSCAVAERDRKLSMSAVAHGESKQHPRFDSIATRESSGPLATILPRLARIGRSLRIASRPFKPHVFLFVRKMTIRSTK